MSVSFDGRLALTRNIEKLKSNRPKQLTGKLVFGLNNSSWAESFTPQFFGSVTKLNIFSVNKNTSVAYLTTNTLSVGDILSWKDAIFALQGNMVSFDEFELKYEIQNHQILLPFMSHWHKGKDFCRRLGKGKMKEILNRDELVYTARLVKSRMKSCVYLWLPVTKESVGGDFRNVYSRDLEGYLPWGLQQPNGMEVLNVAALKLDELAYYDYPASNSLCVSCTVTTTTVFRLRGLCEDSYMGKQTKKLFCNFFFFICRYVLCCFK